MQSIRSGIRDVIFLAGLGTAGYGLSMFSLPAAVIFAGLSVSVLSVLGASRSTNEPPE